MYRTHPKKTSAEGQAKGDYVHQQVGIDPTSTGQWPVEIKTGVEGLGLVRGETTTITLTAEVAN